MAVPKLDLIFPPISNLKLLAIMDITAYDSGYVINDPAIEITPPGFNRVVTIFSPGNLNIYNSANLQITCVDISTHLVDLPDGIWTVKYSMAPASTVFVEKTFLRVDSLKAKFEEAFMKTDMKECNLNIKEQDMEKLDHIQFYIFGAIAEANKCNNTQAMKYYGLASKLIENFIKTK